MSLDGIPLFSVIKVRLIGLSLWSQDFFMRLLDGIMLPPSAPNYLLAVL